ncbi:MAG: MliC family protein [Pseudomonadota bacterium]
MNIKHIILMSMVLILCASCTRNLKKYTYTCDDGSRLTATFDNKQDNMTLTMAGKTLTLNHLISGSGARYGDENIVFWIKGDEARLIQGDKTTNCKVLE